MDSIQLSFPSIQEPPADLRFAGRPSFSPIGARQSFVPQTRFASSAQPFAASCHGLTVPALSFRPTIGVTQVEPSENGKVISSVHGVSTVCLDFDGCLSLLPLTSDVDPRSFIINGGMGPPERVQELRAALEKLVIDGQKRICIVSLNKTYRIKRVLELLQLIFHKEQ